jgi:EmrB/QacA subfamily drug resistance transporter
MNRKIVTAGVLVGLFLAAIESTVVGTAMPTVISQLGGVKLYSAVFTAYMLTSTITVPLWGKLSDIYGRRGFYVLGVLIFIAGSALSGQSTSMPELIAFRALQGLGSGAIMPLCFTIVGEIYGLEERARMQGVVSSVWGFSSIVGPLLGGFLTDKISWRAVFYVSVPFGLVSALLVGFAYKSTAPRERRRLDVLGALLLALSATSLLAAAAVLARPASALPALGLLALAIVLALLFVRVERRAEDPVLHLALFRSPMFRATTGAGFFAGMAMFGVISFVPLFVQAVIRTNATEAGAALTPFMLAWVVSSTSSARFSVRHGYRAIAVFGAVSVVAGIATLAALGAGAGFAHVALAMALCGLGMGATFTPLLIAVQSAVPRERLGAATSAVQFFRSVGGAVGIGILGAVLAASLSGSGLPPGVDPKDVVDPIAREALSPELFDALRGALAGALHRVFLWDVAVAAVALLLTTRVPGGKATDHAIAPDASPDVGH